LPLDRDEVRLAVGDSHGLAKKPVLHVTDLRDQDILLMPWQTRTPFYESLLFACQREGFG
jgi:hypothetical protein